MHRSDDECDFTEERPFHGIAVYYKNSTLSFENFCLFGIDLVLGNIPYNDDSITLCFTYCPPKCATVEKLKKVFEKLFAKCNKFRTPIIIMGDFNINIYQNASFVNSLKTKYGLKQHIENYTTDNCTLIDHMYTNISSERIISVGTLESYYSDHKPIYINIL